MITEKVSFSLPHLKSLVASDTACVQCKPNFKRSLMLLPVYLNNLKHSVRDILASKVTTYDIELGGVILSHKNIKINDAVEINDEGHFRLDYIADIYIFTPQIGSTLTGRIHKKGRDVLGCLVHSIFNVALPRPRSDDDDSPKHWLGSKASIGQTVTFSVVKLDFTGRLPYIRGQLIRLENEGYADDEGADSGMGIPESNEEDSCVLVQSPVIGDLSSLKRKRKHSDNLTTDVHKAKKKKIKFNSSDEGLSAGEESSCKNKSIIGGESNDEENSKLSKSKKKKKNSLAPTLSLENLSSTLLAEAVKKSQDNFNSILVGNIKQEVVSSDSNKSNEDLNYKSEKKRKKKHKASLVETDLSVNKDPIVDYVGVMGKKRKKKHKHSNDVNEVTSKLLESAIKNMPIKVEDIKQEEIQEEQPSTSSSVKSATPKKKKSKQKSFNVDAITKNLMQQTLHDFQKDSQRKKFCI